MKAKPQDDVKLRRRLKIRLWTSAFILSAAVILGVLSFFRNDAAVLIITSEPDGGEVVLGFRPTGITTDALLAGLPADSFIVTLRKDGFRPVPTEQGVRLESGDTTRITFLLSSVARGDERELPRSDGPRYRWQWKIVTLHSDPPGARITMDDMPTGMVTPITMSLTKGLHHFQAEWPNGAKSFKNVLIDPNTTQPDVFFKPATYVQPK
ncbi:PEGA domain-containing protein [bacterium]|nr:PEGA domain-containing protein [bacterium]